MLIKIHNRLDRLLQKGLGQLDLHCPLSAQHNIIKFVHLLDKWNRVYNLTAVRDPEKMLTRHIFDALSVYSYLKGPRIIDVGTGPGLPGLPLALISPDWEFVLLDSNAKKTRFIIQVVSELGLSNISVVKSRCEAFQTPQLFDTVVSRAFTSLDQMVKKTQHLCAKDGIFLAMKGSYPLTELEALPEDIVVADVNPVSVPGLDAERHVVLLKLAA
jgi:16S rRNA (guanine527-N7)-methyltransferase